MTVFFRTEGWHKRQYGIVELCGWVRRDEETLNTAFTSTASGHTGNTVNAFESLHTAASRVRQNARTLILGLS